MSHPLFGPARRFASLGVALACCSLVACDDTHGAAHARTLDDGTPLRWAEREIVLHLAAERPGATIQPWVRDALVRAAELWNDALERCDAPRLEVAATSRPHAAARADRINEVVFHERAWCSPSAVDFEECYDASRHASTRLRPFRQPGNPRHGVIEEADITVNGVAFRWSARGERPGTLSLEAVLAHELGHVLGLDHPSAPAERALLQPNAAEALASKELEPLRAEVEAVCRTHARPE